MQETGRAKTVAGQPIEIPGLNAVWIEDFDPTEIANRDRQLTRNFALSNAIFVYRNTKPRLLRFR